MAHLPRRRAAAATALLAVSGGVLAACGGSGGPSRASVVARADAICQTADRSTHLLVAPAPGAPLDVLATYLGQELSVVDREVAALDALPRPAEDRDLLTEWLAAVHTQATAFATLTSAARRSDATGVAMATETLSSGDAGALATRYGIDSCGAVGGTVGST